VGVDVEGDLGEIAPGRGAPRGGHQVVEAADVSHCAGWGGVGVVVGWALPRRVGAVGVVDAGGGGGGGGDGGGGQCRERDWGDSAAVLSWAGCVCV
jgi:hypothetical protein